MYFSYILLCIRGLNISHGAFIILVLSCIFLYNLKKISVSLFTAEGVEMVLLLLAESLSPRIHNECQRTGIRTFC